MKQLVVLGHEIPLTPTRAGLGLGVIDQLLPFQRSINVLWSVNGGGLEVPTAKQLVVL
jgi:hypothetical protein